MTVREQTTKIWVDTDTRDHVPHIGKHAGQIATIPWSEHMSMLQSFASSVKHPYIISACIDKLIV